MSKLQNVKAVNQLLRGEHKMQTRTVVGYEGKDKQKKREVGEIWEEVGPSGIVTVWEQKQGFRIKTSQTTAALREARDYLESYPKCYEDCKKKVTKEYTRLDKKFRAMQGMCFDCVVKLEAKLKMEGKYEEYEREKMRQNAESFIKDVEAEKEFIKESLNQIEYVHIDGRSEKWDMPSKEGYLEKIDEDFVKLKDRILKDFE